MTWASDLHFCWLVEPWKQSREKYLLAWQKRGWHCVLWHSGQIKEPPVPGVELRLVDDLIQGSSIEKVFEYERRYGSHASCADLFRYLVIFKHGGAYADIDVLPDPQGRNTPSVFEQDEVCFGRPNPCGTAVFLEIRFIRASAGHELFNRLLQKALRNEERWIEKYGGYGGWFGGNIMARTGPMMAQEEVNRYARRFNKTFKDFLIFATLDNTLENSKEGNGAGIVRAYSITSAERRRRNKKMWLNWFKPQKKNSTRRGLMELFNRR
jgi:hypothetical protein